MSIINKFSINVLILDLIKNHPYIKAINAYNNINGYLLALKIEAGANKQHNFYQVYKDDSYAGFMKSFSTWFSQITTTPEDTNKFSIQFEYGNRYFFYTGRLECIYSETVLEAFENAGNKLSVYDSVEKIINDLSSKEDEEFNSVEWQYFKNSNVKKNHLHAKCNECDCLEVIRNEEPTFNDICWYCYETKYKSKPSDGYISNNVVC